MDITFDIETANTFDEAGSWNPAAFVATSSPAPTPTGNPTADHASPGGAIRRLSVVSFAVGRRSGIERLSIAFRTASSAALAVCAGRASSAGQRATH